MWYKAEERCPDFIVGCCLVWNGSRIEWAFLNSQGKFCGSNSYLRDVTHWMPLPAPPTADAIEGANLHPPTAAGTPLHFVDGIGLVEG